MTALKFMPNSDEIEEIDLPEDDSPVARLSWLYSEIDCELVQLYQNSLTMPGINVWCDEEGGYHYKNRPINVCASWTLHNMALWADDRPHALHGPVILTGTVTLPSGEEDGGPLTDAQIARVREAHRRAGAEQG